MGYKSIKKLTGIIIISIIVVSTLIFCSVAIAHLVVFSRVDYDKYDSDYFLVYDDIDALLDFIEMNEKFKDVTIYLFGHRMSAYAVCAELQFEHNIAKVVAASGFDTPEEQWQYSIKRYTGVFYPIVKPFNSLFIALKYGDDKDLSAVDGINSVSIPVLVISAEEDSFYGGKSPIYERQNEIVNPNCTFMLMDKENHNGHYDYFLTDAAIEYKAENPMPPIDKELYMEHDEDIMNMIIEFFDK